MLPQPAAAFFPVVGVRAEQMSLLSPLFWSKLACLCLSQRCCLKPLSLDMLCAFIVGPSPDEGYSFGSRSPVSYCSEAFLNAQLHFSDHSGGKKVSTKNTQTKERKRTSPGERRRILGEEKKTQNHFKREEQSFSSFPMLNICEFVPFLHSLVSPTGACP